MEPLNPDGTPKVRTPFHRGGFMSDYLEKKNEMAKRRKLMGTGMSMFGWFFIAALVLGLLGMGLFGLMTYKCYKGDKSACEVARILAIANSD